MGCSNAKTKDGKPGQESPNEASPQQTSATAAVASGDAHSGTHAVDSDSAAAQAGNAKLPKSAMKRPTRAEEPTVVTPDSRGSTRCEGRVCNAPRMDPYDDDDEAAGIFDRSFVKEDLTGSFRNLSFVSEKGDCRIEKGVMAPSAPKIPAPSSSDRGSSRCPSEQGQLSPHSSDGELVLVCMDCGREINEKAVGQLCPVTARLHA